MKRPLPFHCQAVWPPAALVALFAIGYCVLTAGFQFIQFKMRNMPIDIGAMEETKRIYQFFLGTAAVVYALYRVWRFHPACNHPYRDWLRMSPWTSGQPLPLGPIHLVWQDAAVIGVLAAVAIWHVRINPVLPVIAFGLTYLILLTILLGVTRRWPWFLAAGFLWPALMLPSAEGWPRIVVILVLILTIWEGQRKSLQAFPWLFLNNFKGTQGVDGRSCLNMEIGLKGVGDGPSYLGWPYRVLSPKIERRAIPAVISFFVSALAGWWTYCIVKSSAAVSTPGLIVVFGLMAASIRLLIYCSGVAPPVNVWGRMTSGRILIPGFDKVFLTPLAVVLAGEMGGIAVRHSGSRYAAVESCVIALLGLVLLTGGPTLRNWTLTGQLRFRPTPSLQGRNQNQMLRRV